ncbi:MAG: NAD(P)H-hydrate epimerase [Planctomycetota bacterium]
MHHRVPNPRTLTREQVRSLDAMAIETLGLPGIVLMENAATALEESALAMLPPIDPSVLICCGPGNNGGDGLALARKLHNRGIRVVVLLTRAHADYSGDAAINLGVLAHMNVPMEELCAAAPEQTLTCLLETHGMPNLIVDALLGTGLDRPPRCPLDVLMGWMNQLHNEGASVLAVDVPTGLDCDTGLPLGDHIVHADVTLTLAARKPGFDAAGARAYTGRVDVGDIGLPPELIDRVLKTASV